MNDSADVISDFEEILKNNTKKQPLALYRDQKNKDRPNTQGHSSNLIQDVISSVSHQIKAFQHADSLVPSKQNRYKLDKYKKSTFLTVNILSQHFEEPHKPPAAKFETQLVSDSQLIHIIDNAEALANNGITQEFDCTFSQTDLQKHVLTEHNDSHDKEINNKLNDDGSSISNNDIEIINKEVDSPVVKDNNQEMETADNKSTVGDDEILICSNKTQNDTQLNDNCTEMLNKCLEIETNINELDTDDKDDEEIQLSLVFETKKSKTPSPLVFDLSKFESFEKIAVPIVEESADFKSAKKLINSQIIGKELFIQSEIPHEVSLNEEVSPVLKISAERLKITKTVQAKLHFEEHSTKAHNPVEISKESDDVFLKDEILFSSDEENEYLHKEFHDIPLTCALETSFYEQPDMLDKTMYVGFQTASNRSIQISAESFSKAKSILDDVDKESKVTLTDLVDSFTAKHDMTPQSKINSKTSDIKLNFDAAVQENRSDLIEKEIDNLKRPDKRKFEGFMTANRKKIKLSDMALARCKRVFQDIDIEENFDVEDSSNVSEKQDLKIEDKVNNDKIETNPQIDDDILNEFAHDMSLINDENDEVIKKSGADVNTKIKFFDRIDFSDRVLESKLEDEIATKEPSSCKDKHIKEVDSHTVFMGFKTASNNEINISSKALEKAKNLFEDIKDDDSADFTSANIKKTTTAAFEMEDLNQPSTSKGFGGFKTASNKNIKVSNEALVRSKSIFQDIITEPCESELRPIEIHKSPSLGFKTANNKAIRISNEAYLKTKEIFKVIQFENTSEIRDNMNRSEKTSTKDVFKDIYVDNASDAQDNTNSEEKTSNRKSAIDSDQIKDFDDEFNEAFDTQLLDLEKVHIPDLCGFKTASNKPVNISDKALAQSKNVFKDLRLDDDLNFDKENDRDVFPKLLKKSKTEGKANTTHSDVLIGSKSFGNAMLDTEIAATETEYNNSNKTSYAGFHTASKKPINISAEALAKSKAIFKEIEDENVDISNKNAVNRNEKVPEFKGFQTGSNKPITISANALSKSKEIFKDLDEDYVSKDLNEKPFKGIQTANNKSIEVSAKALAQTKELFKDIDDNCSVKDGIITFQGFQTASKKPVQISAEALIKTKYIFKDIDGLETNDVTKFAGFQTSSKKPVNVSEKALAKSKQIFKDIDGKKDPNENTENRGTIAFKGFQTASNKAVKISAEALAKSKDLFKDIDNEDFPTNPLKSTTLESASKFKGFKTASNKPVQITDTALARSKEIFKDIDATESGLANKVSESKFEGFQTASKKPVKISSEALAKSRAIFQDINEENLVDSPTKIDDLPTFRGFETASKKPVQISKEALAKSKALFKDIDNDDLNQITTKSSNFQGFQTANNKSVKVSEDALAKSKRIFDEFYRSESMENVLPFKGFETANKKKVKISEEALAKSREILQSKHFSDDECKENLDNAIKDQTHLRNADASSKLGKNDVKVSENAFKDPRKLLTDVKTAKIEEKLDQRVTDNLEKLINTQVISNFDQTLYTEDFCKDSTPIKSKRSGSPILSCPRAKRRKFNTPYRNDNKTTTVDTKVTPKIDENLIFNEDYKKNKRYTLKDLANVEKKDKLNTDPYILNFSMETLLDFEFSGLRNDITKGKFSIEDLKEYFLKAVNKKLIPNGWLDNHLKLILWKLISYEVKFTQTLNRVCTAKNVLAQLKYRFDKELYNVERPVLRKILEKDDVASKSMVLCVAGIFVDGVSVTSVANPISNVELLLTDGWYCVKAVIDKMLTKLVYEEKITVGSKIMTNGAELVNCEQGVAPWEDTSSVRLKIFGNSTRRARWDARLGLHGNAAILTELSSVKPEGGKVSKLRLYVTRVYPMLYVEKFEDGSTVTRSERLENIHQIKYESDRQTAMEKLYEEVEKELSDQESQDSIGSQLKHRKLSAEFMTESQTKSLEAKSSKKREKLLQNIQERVRKKLEERGLDVGRNVVGLLKIRVAGVENSGVTKGFMSIWKPNVMLTEIIKEDSWIEIMNVVPTAIRCSEIHLSAGRQSIFSQSKYKVPDKLKPHFKTLARKCYPVRDLAQNPSMMTDFNEIDTVGFIFQIDVECSKQSFQNVYLSDCEKNIICVNFWGGLRKFGFQNLLDTGQIISCTNLQKRAGNTRKSIPQFRVTEFSFFTKTPKSLEARNMIIEFEKKMCGVDRKKFCEECVNKKNNYSNKHCAENVSPYRFHELNLTKNKVFIDSPLAAKCEDNLNLTGLDFESTFRQADTQELSPKSKERKRKVNEKISRLKMIGEPPPLSPMNIINKSKNAFNSYKSPLAQTSVASAKKSTENSNKNYIQSSPIISMNRTYVKNVHPVKLNFSNVQDNSLEEEDQFAEEFDGSPPLSLE
ncbi:breast cancer type 2 susceptibility protein [Ostrinia furnacalis]|uniref:breast cancer type 2 susceptibility protein n=1 Tax=Ostrinia furnacalis TaxID=93504 RepID=UPI001038A151|nr:breast cancer type 2 susceptibility protein [Ostrinia furnacalis]